MSNVPLYMFSFFCFVQFEKSSQHLYLYKVAEEKTISKLVGNSKVENVLIEDICLSDTLMCIFILSLKISESITIHDKLKPMLRSQ